MFFVNRYIWRREYLPLLRVPVIPEIEIGFVSTESQPPNPEKMKHHWYKPTGGSSPELGYEYEYVGTMKE